MRNRIRVSGKNGERDRKWPRPRGFAELARVMFLKAEHSL